MTVETLTQLNSVVSNGGLDANPNPVSAKKSRESERRRRRRKQKKTKASQVADSTVGEDSDAAADEDAKEENNDPEQVFWDSVARFLVFRCLFVGLFKLLFEDDF